MISRKPSLCRASAASISKRSARESCAWRRLLRKSWGGGSQSSIVSDQVLVPSRSGQEQSRNRSPVETLPNLRTSHLIKGFGPPFRTFFIEVRVIECGQSSYVWREYGHSERSGNGFGGA